MNSTNVGTAPRKRFPSWSKSSCMWAGSGGRSFGVDQDTILYQGQTSKSTRMESGGKGHVKAATERKIVKKRLAFPRNKPRLRLPPRPGSGSSGRRLRDALPHPNPSARFLISQTIFGAISG